MRVKDIAAALISIGNNPMPGITEGAQRRAALLPVSLPPIGVSRECAAAYIGVGVTLFDGMVVDGRMPAPRVIGGRTVWDTEEVYAAFKAIPHRGALEAEIVPASDWGRLKK